MKRILIAATVIAFCAGETNAISIDTVGIGYLGNHADKNHFGDGSFGAVDYSYWIGKFEVTNDEYASFLNSIASNDTHSLYSGLSGIDRQSTSSGFAYSAKPNAGNKPVAGIDFWDAARFANWMHNGQPSGAQNSSTTEDGAYALLGETNPPNSAILRKPNAKWFIPNENEWYKAAYFQPQELGGDEDDYWLYPTRSNIGPTLGIVDPNWDIDHPVRRLSPVGSAGPAGASFFGTYDQAGNLTEWIEDIHNFSPQTRVIRGGNWVAPNDPSAASFRNGTPPHEVRNTHGFRMATIISEPSTLLLLVAGCGAIGHRRR